MTLASHEEITYLLAEITNVVCQRSGLKDWLICWFSVCQYCITHNRRITHFYHHSSISIHSNSYTSIAEYKKLEDRVRIQSEIASDNEENGEGVDFDADGGNGSHTRHSIEADGLFVRVLADFDPHEVMEANQVIPRAAISIRSGDILQLLNVSDREWWQVSDTGSLFNNIFSTNKLNKIRVPDINHLCLSSYSIQWELFISREFWNFAFLYLLSMIHKWIR